MFPCCSLLLFFFTFKPQLIIKIYMKKINLNIYKKNYNNYNKNWGGIIRLHSTNNRFFYIRSAAN